MSNYRNAELEAKNLSSQKKFKIVYASFVDAYFRREKKKYFATAEEMKEWIEEKEKLNGTCRYLEYYTCFVKVGRSYVETEAA